MRVAIGSDHAGVALKEAIIDKLQASATPFHDFGAFDSSAVDYPDIAGAVGEAVATGDCERGIMICGTGIGACIAANKVHGVRAALCHDPFSARLSREHNDANVLCLGARVTGVDLALDIARVWLETPFSGAERHARRVGKIARLEGER